MILAGGRTVNESSVPDIDCVSEWENSKGERVILIQNNVKSYKAMSQAGRITMKDENDT
jgi:hypothetical protein